MSRKCTIRQFDENVARDGKLVLGWLGGIGVVAALVMSIVAVAQSGQAHTVTVTNGMMASALPAGAATTAIASLPTRTISLKIIPESKPGLDGAKHDYLTQTEFAVKVGQKLELKIDNTDEGEHSITSPQIGVNIVIKPGVHIYELVVKENGRFLVLRDSVRQQRERLGNAARSLHERLHHSYRRGNRG